MQRSMNYAGPDVKDDNTILVELYFVQKCIAFCGVQPKNIKRKIQFRTNLCSHLY